MKKLSALQVAVALATTHYGLGFLIGTGQDIAEYGAAGMLYAFSTAIGLLTLIPIVNYYWKSKKPIWDIFEKHHGKASGNFTAFLSSFWMVGVVASQILGGSAALMAFGMSRWISTALIAGLILVLSYVDLGKLSKIFFYFLVFSSAVVLLSALKYGIGNIFATPVAFAFSVPQMPLQKLFGVLLTTALITFIGMDFHQFIVAAENERAAKKGAFGGFVILAFLTTILGSSILGFLQTGNFATQSTFSSAQVVPQMLMTTGSSILGSGSTLLFLLPIILVSAGSGSVVTKVIVSASKELLPPQIKTKHFNVLVIALSVLLTVLSQSVVGLVVSFYATYVGAVLIPFFVTVLESKGFIKLKDHIFFNSILFGFALSIVVFFINKFGAFEVDDISIFMLLAGFLGSVVILATAKPAEQIARIIGVEKNKNKEKK